MKTNNTNPLWSAVYGVSIFKGNAKTEEIHFKSKKDFALWLFKNKQLL